MTDYFHLNAAPDTVRAISSLGLAHLGDGVFELMVRSWLCLHGKATSKGLHREALFGWLWLQGRTERLNQLFAVIMEEEECR